MVFVKNILLARVLGMALLFLILLAVVWQGLVLRDAFAQRMAVRFAHRADSYLPDLSSLNPQALRNSKTAERFLAYYSLIERRSPGLPGVWEMLGYCSYYKGDTNKAFQYYQQALSRSPHSFGARYNLGVICYKQDDFTKAINYFQEALSIPEARGGVYVMSARVLTQFMVLNNLHDQEVGYKLRQHYGDAQRFIKLCFERQGRQSELVALAARYADLQQAWSMNGGQPASMDLIVF